ncbi:right-handed parallel beta-helix repeat-containing protein [Paenibacillus sp. M1]|uniref:Right-handed parallel beta-helix repeat-containing protein n=1 Tax=Paenibacillus haidiansis TaxID=1574488 RepID=A0ABU7VRS5_9BACL
MATVINVPGDFPTITAAIAAAAPFDTIRVAPGTYNETVIVNKTIQLLGAQAGVDARTRPGTAGAESIISAVNASGTVQLTATHAVIDGFTIQNNTAGPGIVTAAAGSGYWIFSNIIRNNTFGIYLNSDTILESQVRHNFFISNNQAGAGSGNGVFSENGANFWVDENLFTGHATSSVNFAPITPGAVNAVVSNNTMITDNSIAVTNASNIKIADNLQTNSQGSAIFFGGNSSNVDIEGNAILNGVSNAVRVTTAFVGTPNTNIRMKNNTISGNAVAGLNLDTGAYAVGGTSLALDATNNYWGSPTGPAPIGTGDAVIDPDGVAVVTPFLTEPPVDVTIPQSLLTTGPIMVSSSPIQTAAVLLLNDDAVSTALFTITAYDLSTGIKVPFAVFPFNIPPQQLRYQEIAVGGTFVYELEFSIVGTSQGTVSVWNLDVNKVQILGLRLVAAEIYVLQQSFPTVD